LIYFFSFTFEKNVELIFKKILPIFDSTSFFEGRYIETFILFYWIFNFQRFLNKINMSDKKEKKEKKEKKTKEKKIKTKKVVSTSSAYSKLYAGSFNSKKYSDYTIKIGEEEIPAHKFVLHANSEFFEKQEGDSFTFPKDDDPVAAKALIKFYYTGIYEYTEVAQVVLFTITANKYKTRNFTGKKLYSF
jgi:hypothetical protein